MVHFFCSEISIGPYTWRLRSPYLGTSIPCHFWSSFCHCLYLFPKVTAFPASNVVSVLIQLRFFPLRYQVPKSNLKSLSTLTWHKIQGPPYLNCKSTSDLLHRTLSQAHSPLIKLYTPYFSISSNNFLWRYLPLHPQIQQVSMENQRTPSLDGNRPVVVHPFSLSSDEIESPQNKGLEYTACTSSLL